MTHPITPPGAAHPPSRPDQAGPGTSRSGAAEPFSLWFVATGQPRPKGSMRHVGKGRMVEQLAGSPSWRTTVKDAATAALATQHRGRSLPLWPRQPLCVLAWLTVAKPVSAPKRRRIWPVTRTSGDVDKHARNILDALVDAGVMRDDSQVVELQVAKYYPREGRSHLDIPGVAVRVGVVSETEGGDG